MKKIYPEVLEKYAYYRPKWDDDDAIWAPIAGELYDALVHAVGMINKLQIDLAEVSVASNDET